MPSYDEEGRDAAQRARDALGLRQMGVSYDTIAVQLHYADGSGAYQAVQAELARQVASGSEDAETEVRLELMRLDRMLRGLWAAAVAGDGGSIDRVLRIQERRDAYRAMLAGKAQPVIEEDSVVSISRAREARKARAQAQQLP
jgi:hypothetical protein